MMIALERRVMVPWRTDLTVRSGGWKVAVWAAVSDDRLVGWWFDLWARVLAAGL
jgi:hypothetical protein